MPKMPKNCKNTAKRALLQEEETAPPPTSVTLESQGEEEPWFETLQAMEVINPEDFVPPPPPPPSDAFSIQTSEVSINPLTRISSDEECRSKQLAYSAGWPNIFPSLRNDLGKVVAMWAVMRFVKNIRAGITYRDPEAIEL
ncbi:hypothetical protein Pcinc_010251 [Petrolisthes cinctipes]|uniref:Uncharacterized protein n=1 Tax=Petrolisthes cinctipes TaxID=88211 RepID=A0AAE1G3N1_PETCI|nr:hypothetical protein Pcinc_010251 [Petrolisthes cinctipes]